MDGIIPQTISSRFPKNLILLGYRGSIAHGLHNPDPESTDDIDLMGVYIPDINNYFGFQTNDTVEIKEGRYDCVFYEARKFIRLLGKCNPNVISLLWLRPEHLLQVTEYGRRIIERRDTFLSMIAYDSFHGYAMSQLKKLDGSGKYEGYMGSKRKALVDKYKFDVKNASHIIRLLTMGAEVLRDREVVVDRSGRDADLLREIKTGGVPLAEIMDITRRLQDEMDLLRVTSTLPCKPNYAEMETFCIDLLQDFFYPHIWTGDRVQADNKESPVG